MQTVKDLIIGAGVTGLSYANFSKEENYLIVEKENEPGGLCRTIKKKGFVWDYAGHFFHFSDPNIKKFFESRVSSDVLIHREKDTKIYWNDRFIDYPFQKNIHQLPKDDFIDCLYHLYFKESKEEFSSFEDMLYAKFGKGITEKFLKPYNEKLYACDMNQLDVDAMGRFFPYAEIEDIISNMKVSDNSSYNNSFLYPKEGAEVFIKALLQDIPEDKILLNETILSIDTEKKIVKTNKREVKYERLINTAPLNQFIDLILNMDYKKYIGELSYNKVLVLNLGFDKPVDWPHHWIYVPQKDINFYRVGSYSNIIQEDPRLSLYVEIGFSPNDNVDTDKELNKALDALKEMNLITDHKLIAEKRIIMEPAYIHISQKSEKIKKLIFDELKSQNVYSVGRYGDWKYCSIEDNIKDAIAISKL